MSDLQALIERTTNHWREENIPIRPGVSVATIADFELRTKVKLPQDIREFYLTVDGMGSHYDDDGFLRIWPFEEIRSMAEYLPDFRKSDPDRTAYFVFFDHSIDISLHAIRLRDSEASNTPIVQIQVTVF